MAQQATEGKIFLTTFHHSDLTWQHSYAEYDEIREQQLNVVLDFFSRHPGYNFLVDQAYMLKSYLERNPDKKERVAALIDGGKGRFELAGQFSIPDVNLCSGESFVRNCIQGMAWYEREFGYTPNTASLMDVFGVPAQVPQILQRLGYKYLIPSRMPNHLSEIDPDQPFVWEGENGTGVIAVPNQMNVDKSSYVTNVPVMLDEDERFAKTLADLQASAGNILAYYITEFQMLDEAFFTHLAAANANPAAGRKVTFGRFADYCKTIDAQHLPRYKGEFNPVFSGCYATRIDVKLGMRRAEKLLFAAELAFALAQKVPTLDEAWSELSLVQFHDGICGCHHDICNIDVMRKLAFVQQQAVSACDILFEKGDTGKLLVLNPSADEAPALVETTPDALPKGVQVQQDGDKAYFVASLPAYGAKVFVRGNTRGTAATAISPQGYSGETDCFAFDFSSTFPIIRSKRFGHSVFGAQGFGEIQFRHDSGTMWTETFMERPCGMECQQESVCAVEEGPVFIKVTTKGHVLPGRRPISGNNGDYWPGFEALSFQKEYIFPRSLPYFKLRLTLDFKGCNTKVSLRIPVELNPHNAVALYDTPFAAQQRKPYFEVPLEYEDTIKPLSSPSNYNSAKGDWPALNWVDYRDDNIGIAVANNGTPGHQLVGKNILISLLRSGTRSMEGSMYPQPGAYDNGTHSYEFAFTDHMPQDYVAAPGLGEMLNRSPLCFGVDSGCSATETSAVSFGAKNILVSSIYPQDGALLVRAYEAFGLPTTTTMILAPGAACSEATMRGEALRPQDINVVAFAPNEIKTFRVEAP